MSLLPILGGSSLPNTSLPTSTGTKTGGGSILGIVGQISTVSSLLGTILNGAVINKTIGQALKDGFSCWGSTWTPTRAEEELPTWMSIIAELFKQALNVDRDGLENSVNTFFTSFWGKSSFTPTSTTLENWIGWRYDSAKDCTLKGLIVLEKGVDAFLKELESTLIKIGPEINATITVTHKTITLYRTEAGGKSVNVPYQKQVPQIKVKVNPMANVKDAVEDVQSLASNSTVKWFGGLALAAGVVVMATKSDGKGKSKSKKLYK